MQPRQSDIWGLQNGITQSMLNKFLTCREKFRLSYVEGLISDKAGSHALNFGSCAHEILDMMYSVLKQFEGDDRQSFYDNSRRLLKKCVTAYADLKQESFLAQGVSFEEFQKTVGMVEALLSPYFEVYEDDIFTMDWVDLEKVFSFKVEVSGKVLTLKGKLDGVCRINGDLWLFETKTKGRVIDEEIENKLSIDLQVNLYLLAIYHTYGVWPKGVIYNVIQRPLHKMGVKDTLSSFLSRVKAAVQDDTNKYFSRTLGSVHYSEILEWEKTQLIPILQDLLEWAEGRGSSYKNVSACNAGFYSCEFLPLCGQGQSGMLKKRAAMFEELTEVPLKELQ